MGVELLAPAGSLNSVRAALNAGADAVYAGLKSFSARDYAQNLDADEMIRAIEYAHLYGKKIYLAFNTLLKEDEISLHMPDVLYPLIESGIDAVIVQDFGVVRLLHESFPSLPLHASTQMTVTGAKTADYLARYGIRRITAPRECSLRYLSAMRENTGLEIECFVHGAFCFCVSGQCFLSAFIGDRSANRGKCAQPCRLPYDLFLRERRLNSDNQKYLLSPKDLCTLRILPDIIEAGVYSLKIEGRMKKPEYSAGITALYRKYIDLYMKRGRDGYHVNQEDLKKAADLFNRNGFHEGYYLSGFESDMMSLKAPAFRAENTSLVKEIREKYIEKEPGITVDFKFTLKERSKATLTAGANGVRVTVEGPVPEKAKTAPVTEDIIGRQLKKLGNTHFRQGRLDMEIEPDLFITAGQINRMRRDATDLLEKRIISSGGKMFAKKGCLYPEGEQNSGRDGGAVFKNISEEDSGDTETVLFRGSERKDDGEAGIANRQMEKGVITDAAGRKGLKCRPSLSVLVAEMSVADALLEDARCLRIYPEAYSFSADELKKLLNVSQKAECSVFLAMPHIFGGEEKRRFENACGSLLESFDGFLIRNLEEYFYLKERLSHVKFIFDHNVYTYNRQAKAFLRDIERGALSTVPIELDYRELIDRGCENDEMIVYGYLPAMVTKGCAAKTFGHCEKSTAKLSLRDRKSYERDVRCVCAYCYNLIYNARPLSLFAHLDKIKTRGLSSLRLEFTRETPAEAIRIFDAFARALYTSEFVNEPVTSPTRGPFMRGVK